MTYTVHGWLSHVCPRLMYTHDSILQQQSANPTPFAPTCRLVQHCCELLIIYAGWWLLQTCVSACVCLQRLHAAALLVLTVS